MKIKFLKYIVLVISFFSVLFIPLTTYADSPSIYLSSNISTVAEGGSLIVAVYMNGGGQPINAVSVNLSYPTSQLQYIGLSYSGSPFNIATPSDGGGSGSVSIQNGTISPVSGSALIATVTFHALVSSGSAAISVSGSSQLISATTNTGISYSPSGTSVSFGAVATHSASTASKAATPAPAPVVLPPTTISDVKVTNLTATTATINWTTNNPADSVVDFGLNSSYGLSDSSTTPVTTHSVQLTSSFLLPETLLHYRVQSTDQSGNVISGTDKSLELPGVPVTIIVHGPNGNPQPDVQVTIDNASGTTNSKGSVTLPTSYGDKSVTTSYQGVTVTKPISVTEATKPLTAYQLDLAKQPLNDWMITSIGLIIVVLTLLGIDSALFGSKVFSKLTGLNRHKVKPSLAGASVDSSPVKVDDKPLISRSVEDESFQGPRSTLIDSRPTPSSLSDNDGFEDLDKGIDDLFKNQVASSKIDIKPAPLLKIRITEDHSRGLDEAKVKRIKINKK
jgi:hypothetical protein